MWLSGGAVPLLEPSLSVVRGPRWLLLTGALLLAGVKLAFFDERVTERPVLVSLWEIFPGRRDEQPGTARSERSDNLGMRGAVCADSQVVCGV